MDARDRYDASIDVRFPLRLDSMGKMGEGIYAKIFFLENHIQLTTSVTTTTTATATSTTV